MAIGDKKKIPDLPLVTRLFLKTRPSFHKPANRAPFIFIPEFPLSLEDSSTCTIEGAVIACF